MSRGMISKRYAKALLEYAEEQKAGEIVFEEMKKMSRVYADEHKLRMAMYNPMVTTADKLELIEAIYDGKISKQLKRFIEVVLQNKRETHLQTMALSYVDLYCDVKKINRAKLVTATPVGEDLVEKIEAILKQIKPEGTLDIETEVDPDIQGGFVLYIDTYRYDASIATQLQRIKRDFIAQAMKSA